MVERALICSAVRRCLLCVVVEALKSRLAAYPDIRARHAFLSSGTVLSHQSTLTRLDDVLQSLHEKPNADASLQPTQKPLSYTALQNRLAAYHATQHGEQQQLQAQQATLGNQLATLATHLASASDITHREAGADGALSVVGSMHPSELVGLFARVSDAVDAVGAKCNAVLVDEELVRRMAQAAKGRRWNETAVMRAMLKRPEVLKQAEAELRRRLGEGESDEWR